MINNNQKVGIIYCFHNKLNNKRYIGQTIHPEGRYKYHIKHLGNYIGNNQFYRALNKYDKLEYWDYSILEDNVLQKDLDDREIYWISYYDSFKNGYNMTLGGDGFKGLFGELNSMFGKKHSEESKQKMSSNRKGKGVGENNVWYGKHLPNEVKEKIRKKLTGYKHTEEAKQNMSIAGKGRIFTDEHKKKISNAKKGTKISAECKKRISETLKGRKLLEEHKAKCNVCKGRHRVYNDPNDHSKGWKMVY